MRNREELAVMAKDGDREALARLWEQTRPLIYRMQLRYRCFEVYAFVDQEDFIQCGYLALYDAVQEFNPDKNFKLNSYLRFTYMKHIFEMLGCRKKVIEGKMTRIFPSESLSLDEPAGESEEPWIDLLVDEITDVQGSIDDRELKQVTLAAVAELAPDQRDLIVDVYYRNKNHTEIAARRGLSVNSVETMERKALAVLRKNPALRELYCTYFPIQQPPPYDRATPERIAIAHEEMDCFRAMFQNEWRA